MKSKKLLKYLILSGSSLIIIGVLLFLVIPEVSAATGCFPDTNGHWAETFICWLKANGITGGYPDGTYRPENNVTRAEMSVFVRNVYDVAEANDDDTLAGLSCSGNQIAKWNGSAWVCAADVDTDTDTDTLAGLSCATNQIAKWNGSAWVCAADVDTTGNTGHILINSGHQNWVPFKTSDNLTLEYFSNELWVRKATTGANFISLSPDIPSALYGKKLILNSVRFCYDAEPDAYITTLYIFKQRFSDSIQTLLMDSADRTDKACRTYVLSTPELLDIDESVSLFLSIQWTTANQHFGAGKTTWILSPSNVNATAPEGSVFGAGGSGGEAASPDQ